MTEAGHTPHGGWPCECGRTDSLGLKHSVIDAAHIERQRRWSKATFGPGHRGGVLDHIRKELTEIEADPFDLGEWVDVVILALDGAWRAGHEPQAIIDAIRSKQERNEARTWPDWRTLPTDKAIEHGRSGEAHRQDGSALPEMQQWLTYMRELRDDDHLTEYGRGALGAYENMVRFLATLPPTAPPALPESLDCGCDWDSRNTAGCPHAALPPMTPLQFYPSAPQDGSALRLTSDSLSPETEEYVRMRERGQRLPSRRELLQRLDDCEQALRDTEHAHAAEYARLQEPER